MGYSEALQKAGAEVIVYKEVGSYQGSWGAIVNYDGKKAMVIGSYGSCSGCDAFEAEFGYSEQPHERDGKYFNDYWEEIPQEKYLELQSVYDQRLADFGKSYLETLLEKSDIENRLKGFKEEDWFDSEEKELFEWGLTFFQDETEPA